MGTPEFALPALEALITSNHKIVAVYSQPPRPSGRGHKETRSPVHELAIKHHIPVYTPTSLKTPEAQAEFSGHKADIAVVVAYGLLLPKPILEAYPHGCINIHPSLLPRWRGAAPIQRTIMAGDRKTSIIIMQMDEGLDTGDILLKEDMAIAEGTNAGKLHDVISNKAAPLLLKALDELHSIIPRKQSETGVEYAKKITREDCAINWEKPAHEIYQQILGLSPSPGAFFNYNNEMIKVFDAAVEEAKASQPPGTVLDDNLTIACGHNSLRLLTLQRPNKTRMKADELLRGFHITKSTQLK